MPTPYRSFGDSTAMISRICGGRISTSDIHTLYNIAYREVVTNNHWSQRLKEGVINTVDEYSQGRVAATQGSTSIIGTGTAFTPSLVGMWARMRGDDPFYRVASYTSPTQIDLEVPWPYTSASNMAIEIFQYIYSLPDDCGTPLVMVQEDPIEERSQDWVQKIDPARRTTDDLAVAWISWGEGTNAATPATRTFSQSRTILTLLTENKIAAADINAMYNAAYKEVVAGHSFYSRISQTIINTAQPYTTGTVSVTKGSSTVVGDGTNAFTAGMVGMFIRVDQSWSYYRIVTFTDPQHFDIEVAWPYPSAAAQPFEIFQYIYCLPSDASRPVFLPIGT